MRKPSPNSRQQRVDSLWNVIGCLVYSGCQWGILVATVKLSSTSDVGRLSLGFAVTAPVFLLLHLRLRAASATDAGNAFTASDYVWLRVFSTVLAWLTVLAICVCSRLPHQTTTVILWVATAKAVESGSDLLYGFMQQADDLKSVALSMVTRGIFAFVLFAGILAKTHRLDIALATLSGAWAFALLAVDLPRTRTQCRQAVTRPPSLSSLRRLTVLTVPLGLSTMFMSLMANMPRYFLQHSYGLREVGLFSAAGYLTMTTSVVIGALAEASIAGMARDFADGARALAASALHRVLAITLALSILSVAVSLAFGRPLLRVVYKTEYSSSAALLTGLMIVGAMANLASVYGYALIAARRFKRYLGCLVLSCAATTASCAILIPIWGVGGAAGACLIGYAIQFFSSWWMLRPDVDLGVAALSAPRAATIKV